MAKGKYDGALAELTAKAAGLPDMVKAIKKRMASNSGKISLDTDITAFLLQKTRPSKDEQIELFKQEFKKAYGLSDENYGRMSALISESYAKNPDFMFDSQGGLKAENAESLVLLALDLKAKKDVKFEPFVDRIPEKYHGIKTLGDLIDRYSSVEAGLRQKEQECQAAQSKIPAYEAKISQLQADLNSLEGKIDAKYKAQIADLTAQLEKCKSIGKDSAGAELEMHKILEAMDKYSEKIPPVVRINFYKTYLNLKPQNEVLKGIVLYNTGCAYMNDLQKDETALSYFKKALEISKKEYAANPGSKDAERRRVKYQCGLEACEENIRKANKVVLLTV